MSYNNTFPAFRGTTTIIIAASAIILWMGVRETKLAGRFAFLACWQDGTRNEEKMTTVKRALSFVRSTCAAAAAVAAPAIIFIILVGVNSRLGENWTRLPKGIVCFALQTLVGDRVFKSKSADLTHP